MADTQQESWPDKRLDILVPTTIFSILGAAMVIWRVVYTIKAKRKFLTCDYLLVTASAMDIVSVSLRFIICKHGQGRHFDDPSIAKPEDVLRYSYILWILQIMNFIAMALLKFSICAYLLALKFSRIYLGFVWLSIIMVLVLNLLFPMISIFCKAPFEANWNHSIEGKCWTGVLDNKVLLHSQGVSNILTDIVYVVAPIVYLSSVQISRRTQWGLRIVFCLGLIGTAVSIVKTKHLTSLWTATDVTWDSNALVTWSASELSMGIIIASIPPLRKQFEGIFRRILPSTFRDTPGAHPSGGAIPLYNVSKSARGRTQKDGDDGDGDSETHILPGQLGKGQITKTVVHEVESEERDSSVHLPQRTHSMNR